MTRAKKSCEQNQSDAAGEQLFNAKLVELLHTPPVPREQMKIGRKPAEKRASSKRRRK